jgi:hypothetical protein
MANDEPESLARRFQRLDPPGDRLQRAGNTA